MCVAIYYVEVVKYVLLTGKCTPSTNPDAICTRSHILCVTSCVAVAKHMCYIIRPLDMMMIVWVKSNSLVNTSSHRSSCG